MGCGTSKNYVADLKPVLKNRFSSKETTFTNFSNEWECPDNEDMETHRVERINQFGDEKDVANMTVQDWEDRWELGQTHFHSEDVHSKLQRYYQMLTKGRENLRFYLPLCGKSVDINWLAGKGHTVVGCEGADLGCQQFFEEHGIPFVTSSIPGIEGKAYIASKETIGIYRCDFFDLTAEILGQFDCIWDRGSFVAIPVTRRQEYADSILTTLKKDGCYLLDTFQLSSDIFAGPPFNTSEDDVYKYFGKQCNIEKLDTEDICGETHRQRWGLKSFDEVVYMLTLK